MMECVFLTNEKDTHIEKIPLMPLYIFKNRQSEGVPGTEIMQKFERSNAISPQSKIKAIKVGLGKKYLYKKKKQKQNGISVYCDSLYEKNIACRTMYALTT